MTDEYGTVSNARVLGVMMNTEREPHAPESPKDPDDGVPMPPDDPGRKAPVEEPTRKQPPKRAG